MASTQAIEVLTKEAPSEVATTTPRVAVIIVTWNRKQVASDALRAVSRQSYARDSIDAFVIDNASDDATLEFLRDAWAPERIVHNATTQAHFPNFDAGAESLRPRTNKGGFRSLTIIRNKENMGGCGGFNTGFAAVERILGAGDREPDYAWLLDDDTDLPPNALAQLVRTAESDPSIGLVGSRTVDIHDRANTTESTIYFDRANGTMGPDPAPTHSAGGSHRLWTARSGGTRGRGEFSGVRDVDVVSACSMLARWPAVKDVGLWDKRFFIYCDDADWCLRFARGGYRVVCDLDAVVYHVNWLVKLTPTRAYYSQRNLLWMLQKALPKPARRRVIARRYASILRDARQAARHARLFHAEAMRRAAHDAATNRGGKLDFQEPPFVPLAQAFNECGVRNGSTVLVTCTREGALEQAEALRHSIPTGSGTIRWLFMCAAHVLDRVPESLRAQATGAGVELRRFEPSKSSKWRAQRDLLFRPPAATIIFDNSNEFPLIRGRHSVHIDQRRPGQAQVESDGLRRRLAFTLRWMATSVRAAIAALRDPDFERTDRYG